MNLERSQDPRNLLFIDARSYNRWLPREVTDDEIRAIYDLMKWGPTSANCSPARFVFVRSESGKARLAGCVSMNNRVKVEQAPLTVIVGMDEKFADRLPFLFPHAPSARHWFADQETARITAIRNSSLQGAYFMLAARLLGLDCGPMSGFDNAKLDAEFFGDTSIKSNFIFALGHGAYEMLFHARHDWSSARLASSHEIRSYRVGVALSYYTGRGRVSPSGCFDIADQR